MQLLRRKAFLLYRISFESFAGPLDRRLRVAHASGEPSLFPGRCLSEDAQPRDVYHSNRTISAYIRSGDMNSALDVFRSMAVKSTVTWNSILAGYSKNQGRLKDAQDLFAKIPHPDSVSYNTMLNCFVVNRKMDAALEFFHSMPTKDSASWNIIISGFVRGKNMKMAQDLFSEMPGKSAVSWNAMISGFAEAGDLNSARELFDVAPVKNVITWTAMINGCMKIGDTAVAENLFAEMPERNLVSWNAMIAGYVRNCKSEEGIKLFKKMMEEGLRPNASTLSSLLLACSELCAVNLGRQVHQLVMKSPLYFDVTAGTALVSMYCKCGGMSDAWKLFVEMPDKDAVAWNSIISGYAQHGEGEKALSLFEEMKKQGQKPDSITFVAVILACDHAGMVDLGRKYFSSLAAGNGVEMKREHYTCMINLLGRAGKLTEAAELIKKMPYKPYPTLYGSLLGACRVHKNVEMAEYAAESLLRLNPGSATAYIELANVYAAMGMWDDVARVRKEMKTSDVVKTPGCSWIEIGRVVHCFRSGDGSHPEMDMIHEKVEKLDEKMKAAGYVPDLTSALRNVDDGQKQRILLHHSEKLAVAYGLLKLPRRTTIQVFKNLRICGDCHAAMKYVSHIERREIVIRDTTRFHRFKEGRCSCGDYW